MLQALGVLDFFYNPTKSTTLARLVVRNLIFYAACNEPVRPLVLPVILVRSNYELIWYV